VLVVLVAAAADTVVVGGGGDGAAPFYANNPTYFQNQFSFDRSLNFS
jgi:hypothetical protein